MTTREVFNEITSEHKWYAPYMSAQMAFLFKKRFLAGEIRPDTLAKYFEKFGYISETTWTKATHPLPANGDKGAH